MEGITNSLPCLINGHTICFYEYTGCSVHNEQNFHCVYCGTRLGVDEWTAIRKQSGRPWVHPDEL